MALKWKAILLFTCMAAAAAAVSEERQSIEDATPDAGIDEEDEINLEQEESRNLRPRAYTPASFTQANSLPSGFRPSPEIRLEQALQQRRPQEQEYINLLPIRPQQQLYEEQPVRPPTQRVPHRKYQDQRVPQKHQDELEEELEEKEEPDRLTMLLQQSKFDCVSRNTGYYADEELNCEVFHYCHDGVKHSWICPNGFIFHQVHLICMPPSGDTICQRSSKYHFVNEYLYRPINEEEHQRKPNVSLRYSDRYYPSDIYRDDRYDEDENEDEQQAPQPQPIRHRPATTPRSQPTLHQQVFRTAEEVNIPLLQRRPTSGFVPTQRPYTTPADFDYQ